MNEVYPNKDEFNNYWSITCDKNLGKNGTIKLDSCQYSQMYI